MRQTLKYAVAGAAMFLVAGQASAADVIEEAPYASGMYVSLFAGVSFMPDATAQYEGSYTYELDFDTGFLIGGALGTHLTPNLRGEVELSYSHHDIDDAESAYYGYSATGDGDVGIFYLLGNLWYDFDLGGGIAPYLGFGVGAAHVDHELSLWDDPDSYSWENDQWALAGQLGAGFRWAISDSFDLDVGYRFKLVAPVDFDYEYDCSCYAMDDIDYKEHVLQLGISFGL